MAHAGGYTFSSLLSEHDELEALFNKHQRALLARDIATALAAIARFESALGRHIDYEEEVILPLYSAKRAEVEGGTLPIFQAEHRKLRQTAAKLANCTGALYTSPDVLGSILNLLDDEALFKGLFHHHALREENLLFPRLDAFTGEDERARVLGKHVETDR